MALKVFQKRQWAASQCRVARAVEERRQALGGVGGFELDAFGLRQLAQRRLRFGGRRAVSRAEVSELEGEVGRGEAHGDIGGEAS